MKTKLLTISLCILTSSFGAFAQLTTSNSFSAAQLVQYILGPGVSATNITYTGDTLAKGIFNGTFSNIGVDSGIVLSSGSVYNCGGSNTSGSTSTSFDSVPGDSDISILAGYYTNDAAVLEFDFVPLGDSIKFNFVFGSEEYAEYVSSPFNDAFGFFLSGPGISGPFSSPAGFPGGSVDLALTPSSTIVSINSVNCQNSSPYYVCNDPSNSICSSSYGCPSSTTTTTVEYDGFTTVLTATHDVQKCHTYHIKMAIADAMDRIFDSGVFLEAQSFTVDTICIAASVFTPTGNNTICEGTTVTHYANVGPGFYYQWYKDGVEIDGATSSSLDISEQGSYYVLVYSDSFCSKTSENIDVIVIPSSHPVITSNQDSLFSNYSVGNQWYYNGATLVNETNPYLAGYNKSGIYTLEVTNSNGCSNMSSFTLGIEQQNPVRELKVYPNPASNLAFIEWELEQENTAEISIIDVYGKLVYQAQAEKSTRGKQKISLEELSAGIYIVDVKVGNWSKKIKLIRQ